MSTDIQTELLKIEREKLALEKKSYGAATVRFVIGSILLVIATTGISLYVSYKQEKRALIHAERQLIIPVLIALEDKDYDIRIARIVSFLELGLLQVTKNYLITMRQQLEVEKEKWQEELAAHEREKLAREEQRLAEMARKEEDAKIAAVKAETARKAAEVARLARQASEMARSVTRLY